MEIRININEYADVSYIKKLLSKVKGVVSVETDEETAYSWKEIESSEYFGKVMDQSENDYKKGKSQELTDDLLDEIFND